MTAALEVEGVSSGYGEALVLRDLDLSVAAGEIFALLGKNGMGKSTLLKTVMGYLPARTGRVKVAGKEITGLPPHRYLLNRRIARAKALMAESKCSLTEIALESGFSSSSQFATAFRRIESRTPSDFRRSL